MILRACDWHGAPFGRLVAAPSDGRAVTSWPNHDEAFADVAHQIRKAAEEAHATQAPTSGAAAAADRPTQAAGDERIPTADVRSSNLRLKREFSQLERDQFLSASFEFIARFFEGSVSELAARNPEWRGGLCVSTPAALRRCSTATVRPLAVARSHRGYRRQTRRQYHVLV